MPLFTQRVVGSTRVANNLRAAAAASKNTSPITRRWAQMVRAKLKGTKYPPRRPGQRYKRTGRLANSWKVVAAGKNAWGIENNATGPRGRVPYPSFVVGNAQGKGQAWMHKGRWWKAREIVEGEIPSLREDIEKDIVDKGNGD